MEFKKVSMLYHLDILIMIILGVLLHFPQETIIALCPSTTLLNSTDLTCSACYYSCLSCLTTTTCTTCLAPKVLDSATSICVCPSYMYEFNTVCYGCHYSCLTCISGQIFQCLTCNATDNRNDVTNSSGHYC